MKRGAPVTVGIVANPASGRDIRRLVARASVFPIAEKCSMIGRLLSALAITGVERVLIMPDADGLTARVDRALSSRRSDDPAWPRVELIDMEIESGPMDTVRATTAMVAAEVQAIVVLGGDGTHRLVAKACGEIPLMALSTGTNNVFPAMREATVAGLATGLVATGRVPTSDATHRSKVLRIDVNGAPSDLALVDVAISDELWTGSRALWRAESIREIFAAFAEPDAVGLSSIAGLLRPLSRATPGGVYVQLLSPAEATRIIHAPLAPGLVRTFGVGRVDQLALDEPRRVEATRGVIALDGEREIEFTENDQVSIRVTRDGPLTIDVAQVMMIAAKDGLLAVSEQRDGRQPKARTERA